MRTKDAKGIRTLNPGVAVQCLNQFGYSVITDITGIEPISIGSEPIALTFMLNAYKQPRWDSNPH